MHTIIGIAWITSAKAHYKTDYLTQIGESVIRMQYSKRTAYHAVCAYLQILNIFKIFFAFNP